MANPHAPDPDLVAEAYRLTLPEPKGEALSLSQVAIRLGISKSTARDYVRKAVEHLPYVELWSRAQMQGDMATRLTTVLFEVYEEAHSRRPKSLDDPPDEWLALLDFAAKREAQLAALLGLNAERKLSVTVNGENGKRASVDRGLLQALAEIDETNTADDREIRAGRPGVIEGSG